MSTGAAATNAAVYFVIQQGKERSEASCGWGQSVWLIPLWWLLLALGKEVVSCLHRTSGLEGFHRLAAFGDGIAST